MRALHGDKNGAGHSARPSPATDCLCDGQLIRIAHERGGSARCQARVFGSQDQKVTMIRTSSPAILWLRRNFV